jgi:hypothetical protein
MPGKMSVEEFPDNFVFRLSPEGFDLAGRAEYDNRHHADY